MKYSIRINEQTSENIIFEGYFVTNDSNVVVEFYETINGVSNNVLYTSGIATGETNDLDTPIYSYLGNDVEPIYDNTYLSSWKKFNILGVVLDSMSAYPSNTAFHLHAPEMDETENNLGAIEIYTNNTSTIIDCYFTIIQLPDVIPISDICFPKGTPILTNQGIITIEKLTKLNTIDNKKIIGITKTVSLDNYLVCFKKNALGINIPYKDTIMSKNHKIFYKGTLKKAKDFISIYENVTTVPYNKEILYNVLLEDHYKMNVNNLICETLNPTSEMAKIYNYITLHPTNIKNIVKKYNNEIKRKMNLV
jgi:hypothetical protein